MTCRYYRLLQTMRDILRGLRRSQSTIQTTELRLVIDGLQIVIRRIVGPTWGEDNGRIGGGCRAFLTRRGIFHINARPGTGVHRERDVTLRKSVSENHRGIPMRADFHGRKEGSRALVADRHA
jgi:hypothetical protein